jgi:hypothetical protein
MLPAVSQVCLGLSARSPIHDDGGQRVVQVCSAAGETPLTVFEHLYAGARDWGPVAGVVDADMVRRQLRWRGLRLERSRHGDADRESERVDVEAVTRNPLAALDLQADLDAAEMLLAGSRCGLSRRPDVGRRSHSRSCQPARHIVLGSHRSTVGEDPTWDVK